MSNTLRIIFGLEEKAAALKTPSKWSKQDFDSYLKGRKLKQGVGSLRDTNKKPSKKDFLMGRAMRDGGSVTSHGRQAFWAGMAGVKTKKKKKKKGRTESEVSLDLNQANPLTQRLLLSPKHKRDMGGEGKKRSLRSVGTQRDLGTQGSKRSLSTQDSTRVWGNK